MQELQKYTPQCTTATNHTLPPIWAPGGRLPFNAHRKRWIPHGGIISGYLFATCIKTAGTRKTTIKSLTNIYENFAPAEIFVLDGGRHFDNMEVKEFCNKWGGKHHVVVAYSPWINGLVEGIKKSCYTYWHAYVPWILVKMDGKQWNGTTYQEHGQTTLTKLFAP